MARGKDGADTKKERKHEILDYASIVSSGVEYSDTVRDMAERTGLNRETVQKYISELCEYGAMSRDAGMLVVDSYGYQRWLEASGIRSPPMEVVCSDCMTKYTSRAGHCPNCNSVRRELYDPERHDQRELEGTPTHIHTHPQTENMPQHLEKDGKTQTLPEKNRIIDPSKAHLQPPLKDNLTELEARELGTHTYTHTQESTTIPRQERARAGRDAEVRAVGLLGEFGNARLGAGTNGEPDVLLFTENNSWGIEVKSLFQKRKAKSEGDPGAEKENTVCIKRESWEAFCKYCEIHELEPLLFVELKVPKSKYGNIYHFIPRESVDWVAAQSDAVKISIPVSNLTHFHLQSFRPGLPWMERCVL